VNQIHEMRKNMPFHDVVADVPGLTQLRRGPFGDNEFEAEREQWEDALAILPVDVHYHMTSMRIGLIGKKVTADAAQDLLQASLKVTKCYAWVDAHA
jgi:hypothetical protein